MRLEKSRVDWIGLEEIKKKNRLDWHPQLQIYNNKSNHNNNNNNNNNNNKNKYYILSMYIYILI